ncbi:helix-turn-helix transcriptional regulator [Natrialba sp. SSL1]|uniref:helix-turn-helix transcriptional regulator n=1 Tax=Natrialba sp. SSL1 TaxID=1869245 RepID=UPI0008F8B3E2|nr:hypothetical protein [Natrialba sp. SSL1]OIB59257.1 hypothetical protein BBD46_00825 [Natrialba sp. SSL1]
MTCPLSEETSTVLDTRSAVLEAIVEQPRPKDRLEQEFDFSRSTLDRAIRELAAASFIEYTDGVWQATLFGQYCYRARTAYHDQLRTLTSASSILEPLSNECPITYEFIDGADVYESDSSMPDAVMQTFIDSLEQATTARIAIPTIVTGFVEPVCESVTTGTEGDVEIFVPATLFERLQLSFPALTDKLRNDSNVTLSRSSVPFTFGLWIADSMEAGIIVFTERGVGGVLVNDTDAAVEWATIQYEHLTDDAPSTAEPQARQ